MKNIIKKLVLVSAFIVVGIFYVGGHNALASSAPTISSFTTANITSSSIDLNGSVNPNGADTNAYYQLITGVTKYNLQDIGSGTGNVTLTPIPYTLTGLTPSTSYQVRLCASNINGPTCSSSWTSFTTTSSNNNSSSAPTIDSFSISDVTSYSVNLNGSVNPNGADTNAYYQLITSVTKYDLQDIGSGTSVISITPEPYTLTGLTPSTSYQVELCASNVNGPTCSSSWTSFTTSGSNSNSPTISSINPDSGTQGDTNDTIQINGTNFISGSTVSFSAFGITINSTTVSAPSLITVNISISGSASTGAGSLTVTNSNGSTSGTFTVNAAGGGGGGSLIYQPIVNTLNATNITNTSATLNGSVNANGYATTAWFQYGTSQALGYSSIQTPTTIENPYIIPASLSQNITGLSPNTTYFFQVIAQNSYGTVYGNISTFTTTGATTTTTTTNPNGVVTTVQATNQYPNSATLNGIFVNESGLDASGYFQYGTSQSLGSQTSSTDLGTSSSETFSNGISNLTPNTIYYFRAVATSGGSIFDGNILVFETPSGTTTYTPPPTTSTVTTTQSSILKITDVSDNVAIGDTINYLVTFKNTNTIRNFENTRISIQLPKEVDFVNSNFGKMTSGNVVEFDPGLLIPQQVGSMTITGKVNSKAVNTVAFVTTAIMSYNVTGSTDQKDEIAYVVNHVVAGNNLSANALFGAEFLPSTLIGWLVLILIILGLVILGRKLYTDYAMKSAGTAGVSDMGNDHADHIDQLPM